MAFHMAMAGNRQRYTYNQAASTQPEKPGSGPSSPEPFLELQKRFFSFNARRRAFFLSFCNRFFSCPAPPLSIPTRPRLGKLGFSRVGLTVQNWLCHRSRNPSVISSFCLIFVALQCVFTLFAVWLMLHAQPRHVFFTRKQHLWEKLLHTKTTKR